VLGKARQVGPSLSTSRRVLEGERPGNIDVVGNGNALGALALLEAMAAEDERVLGADGARYGLNRRLYR